MLSIKPLISQLLFRSPTCNRPVNQENIHQIVLLIFIKVIFLTALTSTIQS